MDKLIGWVSINNCKINIYYRNISFVNICLYNIN